MKMNIKSLISSNYHDIDQVGGKAASLGEMLKAKINVPPGFVITTNAFQSGMTESIKAEILTAFDELGCDQVAVRSSAVAEDSMSASWAGQLESYLGVTREKVIASVEQCWASIKSERAVSYAQEHHIPEVELVVAVVVQKMVDSDVSGVLFSVNPITNNENEILTESIYGLGELLVQGEVSPDRFVIEKNSGNLRSFEPHRQSKVLRLAPEGTSLNEPSKTQTAKRTLDDNQIVELQEISKTVESYYGKPQDIEWALESGVFYVVQSRPITTIDNNSVSVTLPEFFDHVQKSIARPATLQRDELFRLTSNCITPIEVVTIPIEGYNRAYYLESTKAKLLLGSCLKLLQTRPDLEDHIKAYENAKKAAVEAVEAINKDQRAYRTIFDKYRTFQELLSPYLYTALAIDAILYPQFKEKIEEELPNDSTEILQIVATPNELHEYQRYRMAICNLHLASADNQQSNAKTIAEQFRQINEYAFVEPLITLDDVLAEAKKLTDEAAKQEIKEIQESVDKGAGKARLQELLSGEMLTQALLIKEYALLRTDRIDQLKRVQAPLRLVYQSLADDMSKKVSKAVGYELVVNLLNDEIDEFIDRGVLPKLELAIKRLSDPCLYYYGYGKAVVTTDSDFVAEAIRRVEQTAQASVGSVISRGTTAFGGKVSGRVCKVEKRDDLEKVQEGDIIVARVTMPDYTPAMKRAGGFITAEGGITSHAAIIARELKKPCIVGADNCMSVLKTGDLIRLDSVEQVVTYIEEDTVLPQWEKEDTFRWGPIPGKLFYISDYLDIASKLKTVISNYDFPETLLVFHKGQMVWLSSIGAMTNFGAGIFRNEVLNKSKYAAWQGEFEDAAAKLEKFQDSLGDIAEVGEIWREFYDLVEKFWLPTLAAELGNYGSASVLTEALKAHVPEHKLQEVVHTLIAAEESTYNQREEMALANTNDLIDHQKKYFWLQNSYAGAEILDENFFAERKKTTEQIDLKHKISKVVSAKRDVIKKYDLPETVVAMSDAIWRSAIWQDRRKELSLLTFHYKRKLLERASEVLHTPLEILEQYSSKEVLQLIDNPSQTPLQIVNYVGVKLAKGSLDKCDWDTARRAWELYAKDKAEEGATSVKGTIACTGDVETLRGVVRIVHDPKQAKDFTEGDILVTPMTSPDFVFVMRKASAIITDTGGITSHAAIVSRELNKPCIIGTRNATSVFKDGDGIVLDMQKGIVELVSK
jgi:phosphoenolpyruvate synthase/pyruvate phosphate dikinase